ncbi:MAG: class I SAM-dependent methyltransferase [Rhodothermales bacterium]
MHAYWDVLTHPLLRLFGPRVLVEIGAERGEHTRHLLGFCHRHDAVLHTIDPSPQFDVPLWTKLHGPRLVVHQGRSLDALPGLPAYDMVLIDGDHNWFTVFHELKRIEADSRLAERSFPLVMLHDVAWPYGRRDLYYDPDSIPADYRHPYAQKGLRLGDAALQAAGGYNAHLFHAVEEGTPRNGVWTAVEDFLEGTSLDLDYIFVPGFHGLGLLFPSVLRQQRPDVGWALDTWALPEPVRDYVDRLEAVRLHLSTAGAVDEAAPSRYRTG